jgi:hypothetical protein
MAGCKTSCGLWRFRHCCYRKIIKANLPLYHQTLTCGWEPEMKLNKNDEAVVAALKAAPELSMAELAEKTGVPSKKVFKSLKKLFEAEMIDSHARKYRLLTDKVPNKKDEDAAPEEEE